MTNNLYKPAPTPPITYTKSDFCPTIKMYILILSGVGAGLGDYRFSAIMVGKTRPYNIYVSLIG
jgi:hypothetical protein